MSDPKKPIEPPIDPADDEELPIDEVEEVVHPHVIPGDPTDPPGGG